MNNEYDGDDSNRSVSESDLMITRLRNEVNSLQVAILARYHHIKQLKKEISNLEKKNLTMERFVIKSAKDSGYWKGRAESLEKVIQMVRIN